jgi:hypothetical protein
MLIHLFDKVFLSSQSDISVPYVMPDLPEYHQFTHTFKVILVLIARI